MTDTCRTVFAGVLCVAALLPASATAATKYASPTGNAENSGDTAQSPWSLAKAISSAAAGDTVLMAAGAYAKPVVTNVARTGLVTFRPSSATPPSITGMELTSVDGLRFEDVTFTGRITAKGTPSGWQFVRVRWSLPGGIGFANFTTSSGPIGARGVIRDFRWENCEFVGPGGATPTDGIALLRGAARHRGLSVRGSSFRLLGGDGIQAHEVDGLLVEGNTFDRVMNTHTNTTHSDMLQVVGPSNDVRVTGNLVNGGRGMIAQPNSKTGRGALTGLTLENNVFSGRQFGARLIATPGARILGNTFWSASGDSYKALELAYHGSAVGARQPGEGTTGVVLRDNIIRKLGLTNLFGGVVTITDQSNNLIKFEM